MAWQKVNSGPAAALWLRLCLSFSLLVVIAPGWITTHLQPCSALESWSNWASWWIHGALIRLAQAKHTHGALSGMLFSVAAHSWGDPSLCECLAVCLFMSLAWMFGSEAAVVLLVVSDLSLRYFRYEVVFWESTVTSTGQIQKNSYCLHVQYNMWLSKQRIVERNAHYLANNSLVMKMYSQVAYWFISFIS